MCQAKPGKRCAASLRRRVQSTANALQRAQANGNEQKVAAATNRALEAVAAYDASPGGQRELTEALAQSVPGSAENTQLQLRARAAQAHADAEAGATPPVDAEDPSTSRKGQGDEREADNGHGAAVDPERARAVLDRAGLVTDSARGTARSDRGAVPGLRDPRSAGPRLLIGGRTVDPVAVHVAPPVRAAVHRAHGQDTPTLYELAPGDAAVFRDAIAELAKDNPYASAVTVHDEAEYARMRLLLTDNGRAGVAVDGDDIVSVFARPGSYRGVAGSLLSTAVAAGGRRLDCYDTVLPRLYAREGFVACARLGFSDEYAPPGWNYELFSDFNAGRPDVVFMTHRANAVDGLYDPNGGVRVASYDDGVATARAATQHL